QPLFGAAGSDPAARRDPAQGCEPARAPRARILRGSEALLFHRQALMIRAVIVGVSGRMGRALVRAASELSDFQVSGAVASATSSALGQDAGELAGVGTLGVPVTHDLAAALARADVAIDFSTASSTRSNLAVCVSKRKPIVIG